MGVQKPSSPHGVFTSTLVHPGPRRRLVPEGGEKVYERTSEAAMGVEGGSTPKT